MCDYSHPCLPAVFVLPVWCWTGSNDEPPRVQGSETMFSLPYNPVQSQQQCSPSSWYADVVCWRGMLTRSARGGPAVSCVIIAAMIVLHYATPLAFLRWTTCAISTSSFLCVLTANQSATPGIGAPHLIVPVWFWHHSIFYFLASVGGLALFSWMVTELTAPSPEPFLFQSSILD